MGSRAVKEVEKTLALLATHGFVATDVYACEWVGKGPSGTIHVTVGRDQMVSAAKAVRKLLLQHGVRLTSYPGIREYGDVVVSCSWDTGRDDAMVTIEYMNDIWLQLS